MITKNALATDTMQVTEEETLALDDNCDFPPVEDGDDGEGRVCSWQDDVCAAVPEYYIISYCDDPDCPYSHSYSYCKRHYAMRMKSIVDHLHECPGYVQAHTADERIDVVAHHIAGFGHIGE
ncbi:hypothetical protein PG2083B_0513 [Bifidobacterium pseudolongum subsp. globosum]|uniref:hypothetical protein n=1 Tax=Bifidobacterium pseudolongum TaxID=1694 RepID=UPI0010219182|nr:hypothetical protein [Bifidobacterium pseudolongum]RYQ18374.1 hypothetical protein PG2083B_0513 [Bifidobacterium pseudolongum subsp. globosum]